MNFHFDGAVSSVNKLFRGKLVDDTRPVKVRL